MDRSLKVLAAPTIGLLALLLGTAYPVTADEPRPITAIDILLEPDAAMVKKAEAANERLLKDFPKGFALGKTHQPHISCLQRYVKTADLDKMYEAVAKVLAEEKPNAWKLKAYKYDFAVWDKLGVTVILIEPTDDLIGRFNNQARLIVIRPLPQPGFPAPDARDKKFNSRLVAPTIFLASFFYDSLLEFYRVQSHG